jgi:hypothetical protein
MCVWTPLAGGRWKGRRFRHQISPSSSRGRHGGLRPTPFPGTYPFVLLAPFNVGALILYPYVLSAVALAWRCLGSCPYRRVAAGERTNGFGHCEKSRGLSAARIVDSGPRGWGIGH